MIESIEEIPVNISDIPQPIVSGFSLSLIVTFAVFLVLRSWFDA